MQQKKRYKKPETEIADKIMAVLHDTEIQHAILACTLVTGYLLSRINAPIEELDTIVDHNAVHLRHLIRQGISIRQARERMM